MSSISEYSIKQHFTTFKNQSIQLIPPLSEEFHIYGGEETVEKARAWSLTHRYMLVGGVPACAHGMYMMECPANCYSYNHEVLDHVNMWADDDSVFLLSHPYAENPRENPKAIQYARAHGLSITPYDFDDGWYGHGSSPLRLRASHYYSYPIEKEINNLLRVHPIRWPDEPAA